MSQWQYGTAEGLECAIWRGKRFTGLRMHFHPEAQLTLVAEGTRCFRTPFGLVKARAGQGILFPPGLPHQGVAAEEPFISRSLYLPGAAFASLQGGPPVVDDAETLLRHAGSEAGFASGEKWHAEGDLPPCPMPVAALARQAGVSREHFSRRFKARHGMAPASYSLNQRLNLARTMLRAGMGPAEAAYAAAFSDQSHLNRHFKAMFGIEPGRYRAALAQGR